MPETTTQTPPAEKLESSAQPITAAEIVLPLGERMPPVTEGQEQTAPEATSPDNATKADPYENARDAKNQKFARARHQVDAEGKPRLNRKGNFILRTDYRNAHSTAGSAETGNSSPSPTFNAPIQPGTNLPPAPLQDEYDAASEIYLQSAYGPVIIAFSEHARPDQTEHSALKVALANWLRVKQIKEPSPGWALMFTVCAVAVKKSEHPEVRERAKTLWERLSKSIKSTKLPT